MKNLLVLGFLFSLIVSFLFGKYFANRNQISHEVTIAHPKILVTEFLLHEYLKDCNKPGYRRFSTFHEHNMENVLRKVSHVRGYPYFMGYEFEAEMKDLFSPHKTNHDAYKTQFRIKCGEP